MIRSIVLILFIAALVADIYIYRSLVRRYFRPRGRLLWGAAALVTDGSAFCALLIYAGSAHRETAGMVAVMWLVWLFLVAFVPKILYLTGGVLDRLAGLAARRRVHVFRLLGLALSAAVVVTMICGATVGRTRLRVEQVEVCSEKVPEAFDGYRIVQVSDIHIGTMLSPKRQLTRLVEKIARQGGDMIAVTGDLVNLTHNELTPELARILAGMNAPDGVWSVLGNHDLGFYIGRDSPLTPEANLAALDRKVEAMGWRLLSDSSTLIKRGADSILVTGLDYPRDPMLNSHNESLAGVDIGAAYAGFEGKYPFNVAMAHTPKLWPEIRARGRGDLTLSGHVHAMQTKIGFGDHVWSPARGMYREWSGKYTSGGGENINVLYVNDGIGCVGYPMRIGVRGEITVITLKRCE
jgi:predicted MPP superfamily phosphohydrolase